MKKVGEGGAADLALALELEEGRLAVAHADGIAQLLEHLASRLVVGDRLDALLPTLVLEGARLRARAARRPFHLPLQAARAISSTLVELLAS